MKILKIQEIEKTKKEIEKDKLFSVYIFGLPRSGTSMMTHIVELLGVNMIYTSEEDKEKSNKRYKERFGEYHPNPTGFYEVTKDMTKHYLRVVSTPYSGCKMIVPVVGHRFEWVRMYPSKVILMLRDPEEIRQSQMAYYRQGDISIAQIRALLAQEKVKLRNSNIDFITVEYRNVLKDPIKEILRVKKFIKSSNQIDRAVSFVNPKQNRYKAEELVKGL